MQRITRHTLYLTVALAAVGLVALLLVLAAGAQPAAQAAGNVIKVPGDYATIQDAIDAAEEGDTILVARGELRIANLSISKGITLSGGWDPSFTAREMPTYTTALGGGAEGRDLLPIESPSAGPSRARSW